jgi:CheY-like chemotaxis protein
MLEEHMKIIIVVEDDDDTLTVLALTLSETTQFQVYPVKSGLDALQLVTQIRPDLFILDYRLPEMSGIQLYDQLHAIPRLENIPAIIVSATTSGPLIAEAESRRLVRLEKPFDMDEFVATIKQVLDQSFQVTGS